MPTPTPKSRMLFEMSPEPAWLVERDTLRFLDINREAIARYGYSREEFLGMRLSDLHAPEEAERLRETIRKERREPETCEARQIRKNGSTIDVELLMRHLRYGGKPAVLIVPRDCGRKRQMEDQLRQAQRMEAVGMLAGGIAHDFNNLLTIINGYTQLLLIAVPESDASRSALDQIMKAGERAAELTRQLLTFSRRQAVRPRALDLNGAVTSMATMLRRLIGEHIELRIVAGSDLGSVHADPSQIEQVIMNLAVNARDAMSERGGTLVIETGNAELDDQYAGKHLAVKPGSYVMLAVTDTGHGMDAETRGRLFEPFFTTKGQGRGTGLGLSTVYGIIKQSGGSVEVYSEPEMGTTVKVYLPRADQPAIAGEPQATPQAASRGSETILVAEDEEAVRKLVCATLERAGYRVMVAASGEEAVKQAAAHPERIDLLITDMVMPHMGGRELAPILQAARPGLRVLYISGYTDGAMSEAFALQHDGQFLQKPFTPSMLAAKVRQILDASEEKSQTCGR